ncbi:MAG: LysR substrate-binding domain-containing protein [Arenicella sp.]
MKESLKNVTLRQLQIFLVAAEHESFAQAAQILYLTQPAVSMQMKRLAEMVGVALFSKEGRNLRLTRAGHKFVPYVRQITQTLREAGEELDAIKGMRKGKVKIGMVTTTQYFSPRLTAEFKKQHPEIELDIAIANRRNIINKLESNEIDLAIMGRTPKRLEVAVEEFYEHPYVVIASPAHPLAGQKNVTAQNLQDQQFLAREQGSGTRMILERFFVKNDLKQPAIQEFTSNESIKQGVMVDMGLAFISAHTIHLEKKSGLLAVLDVNKVPIMRSWLVLNLANKTLNPATEAFKQFVRNEGAGHMQAIFS